MAAYFIDIDGTTFYFGTDTPIPGALEHIKELIKDKNQIIFVTARNHEGEINKVLRDNGIKDFDLLLGVSNPRVLINDMGAYAINRETDTPWINPETPKPV